MGSWIGNAVRGALAGLGVLAVSALAHGSGRPPEPVDDLVYDHVGDDGEALAASPEPSARSGPRILVLWNGFAYFVVVIPH